MPVGPQRLPGMNADTGKAPRTALFDASAYDAAPKQPAPDVPIPQRQVTGQLPMFMTPRDIKSQFQVLDGDRQDYGEDSSQDYGNSMGSARNWQRTDRSKRTGGESNEWNRTNTAWAESPRTKGNFMRRPQTETDDQVYDRKLGESQMDPDEYAEERGGGGTASEFDMEGALDRASAPVQEREGTSADDSHFMRQDSYIGHKMDQHYDKQASRQSLYDSVAQHGVMGQGIHLSTNQFGSQNKPSVVGGHHRLAAAGDINPDRYVPVQWSTDLHHAQSRPDYT